MKWKKLGKIFDPVQHQLANDCTEFAQSPQAVVFDEFVRIYFSTRKKDPANGKFLSHIAFVDMDPDFTRILGISSDTVIELGRPGTFDEHGIFPISPVKCKDKILAYTCGWSRRVAVSVETSTGLAISHDNGLTFEKQGEGPIFSSSLHEPFLVGDSFVRVYKDVFHMWYIFGTHWLNSEKEGPARVYKIGHATSTDGINWIREGRLIVPDRLNAEECQALPTVIDINGRYHMFFCYRHATDFRRNSQRGYRIGHAFSKDGSNWNRDDENTGIDVSAEGWDNEMMCYPHIFSCRNKIYLLYNGNQFGRYGFGLAVLEQD